MMPTTDWNWFFSSVSQSAAAIVGIFGAFIVTKILANQSAFAEKTRRLQELITLGDRLVEAASRLSIEWYHEYDSNAELDKLEDLLEKDGTQEPELLYAKLSFSPYIAKANAIQMIALTKLKREKRLRREQEEREKQIELARTFGAATILPPMDQTSHKLFSLSFATQIAPKLILEREKIDTLYAEVTHHTRVVSDFHALVATNSESSPMITASLVLILTLFFVGVIYPLSFMPLPTDWKPALALAEVPKFIFSLRGVLLIAVSVLFSAMLAMFFVLNIRMRYPKNSVRSLAEYANLSRYSQFFANREDNSRHHPVTEAPSHVGDSPSNLSP